jgi:hypothetical protein
LNHELGIQPAQIPLSDFVYLTRIHYLAPSDGLWGEHESTCLWHKQRPPTSFLLTVLMWLNPAISLSHNYKSWLHPIFNGRGWLECQSKWVFGRDLGITNRTEIDDSRFKLSSVQADCGGEWKTNDCNFFYAKTR